MGSLSICLAEQGGALSLTSSKLGSQELRLLSVEGAVGGSDLLLGPVSLLGAPLGPAALNAASYSGFSSSAFRAIQSLGSSIS